MPELPDVEVFKRYLKSFYQEIKKVEVRSHKILEGISVKKLKAGLEGHFLESTRRHGKYLFVRLDNSNWLVLHFGMTGYLKYFKDIEKCPPHTRLLISFHKGPHLAYMSQRQLGGVGLIEGVESFIKEKNLGPDVLDLDFKTFKKLIEKRRGAVKSTLMNQKIIAGIGNIYSDEILFHSGIHPKFKVNQLNENKIKELFRKMKKVLQTAINCRADPEQFPDSYLLPHRYEGGERPHCGTELERIKVSGRTAYYCPKCQSRTL